MTIQAIALSGAEGTGKSTLALALTARLRTQGVLADVVNEAGRALPFPPASLDESMDAWVYMVANKLRAEAQMRLRPHTKFVVSDRSPVDFAVYQQVKLGLEHPGASAMLELVTAWTAARYDFVYFFPVLDAPYREDGYRAPAAINTWRAGVDRVLPQVLEAALKDRFVRVEGATYDERAQFVWSHVSHHVLGAGLGERARSLVQGWLDTCGHTAHVGVRGSRGLHSEKPYTADSDVDLIVRVPPSELDVVHSRLQAHRAHLESELESNLDIQILPTIVVAWPEG